MIKRLTFIFLSITLVFASVLYLKQGESFSESTVIAMYVNGVWSSSSTIDSGYTLDTVNSNCTSGGTLSQNSDYTVNAKLVSSDVCMLYFTN